MEEKIFAEEENMTKLWEGVDTNSSFDLDSGGWFDQVYLPPRQELRDFYADHSKAMATFYIIISILGIFGNSLVLTIVLKVPKMITTTNVFICNLACADLVVTSVVTLVSAAAWLTHNEPNFPTWMGCQVFMTIVDAACYTSIYTLVLIAAVRYLLVCRPGSLSSRARLPRTAIAISLTLWVVAVAGSAGFIGEMYSVRKVGSRAVCTPQGSGTSLSWTQYQAVFTAFGLFLPLVVIAACSWATWRHLQRMRAPRGLAGTHVGAGAGDRAVLRLLVAVVAVFAACWTPLHVVHWLLIVRPPVRLAWYTEATLHLLASCLALGHSALNPVLYAATSRAFREGFKAVLTCRRDYSTMAPPHEDDDIEMSDVDERANGKIARV